MFSLLQLSLLMDSTVILQPLAPIQYPLTSEAFRVEIKRNKLNTAYCFEDWNFETQNNTAYCFLKIGILIHKTTQPIVLKIGILIHKICFCTQKRAQPVPYASRTGPLTIQSWDWRGSKRQLLHCMFCVSKFQVLEKCRLFLNNAFRNVHLKTFHDLSVQE